MDFLEQSERSYPKSNSIILAYFSTERDKSLFRAKYDKIANVIFLDNDSFLLELDKFNKPYFFVIDRYCRAYSFLAIPDDFPSIKESYFESLYEEFTAVNYKNIPNIHIVF